MAIPTTRYGKNEKRRIMKNVIMIGIAFMFLFTASASMNNLQSSINAEDGLGVYSQAAANTAVILSSLLLPKFIIYKLTAKWTMVYTILACSIYIAVQFYPTFYTMLPAGFIVGLVSVVLWSAKCTYLTHIGQEYATLSGEEPNVVVVRFFGIFFLLFQCCQIWGNLISSAVLARDESVNITDEALEKCGAYFCKDNTNSSENSNLERPSDFKIYTLASIYLVIAACAALLVIFLVDPLTRYGERERLQDPKKLTNFKLLIATFYQMVKPKQLLLIPLTIWSGVEQGFFSADFAQAYVSCSVGVAKLGLIFICFGVSDAIASVGFGQLIKFVGRVPIFILGLEHFSTLPSLCFCSTGSPLKRIHFCYFSVQPFGEFRMQFGKHKLMLCTEFYSRMRKKRHSVTIGFGNHSDFYLFILQIQECAFM